MSPEPPPADRSDEREELVSRVASSVTFEKSPRLRALFFTFVAARSTTRQKKPQNSKSGFTSTNVVRGITPAKAARVGAFVIEDDYDSEYRFEGPPVPALQSFDNHSSVIFMGSFSKTVFPALRLGYVVLPEPLIDVFSNFRYRTDFRNSSFDQAVLCDFITDGHLTRHFRRMRNLYAERLATLMEGAWQHLGGLLEISTVRAGLYTIAYLKNEMASWQAEKLAEAQGIEVFAVDRCTLKGSDPKALLLGFGGFDDLAIRQGLARLAKALG